MNGYCLAIRILALCLLWGLTAAPALACNQLPVADIDNTVTPYQQHTTPGATVTLDGSDSYDPDGDSIITYQWTIYRWTGYGYTYSSTKFGEVKTTSFSSMGMYRVYLDVEDEHNAWSNSPDACYVYLVDTSISSEEYVSLGGQIQTSVSVDPSNIGTGTARLSKSCSGSGNVNVYRMVDGNLQLLTLPWSWPLSHGTLPSPLYVEGTATSSAVDDVTLTLSYVAGGQTMDSHSMTLTVGLKMKLEKIGFAIGEPPTYPRYPEITTVRATAVLPDGQVCSSFTGTVYIGEDTSDPDYIPVYSQNGGSLPTSITFTTGDNGIKTFDALSLCSPLTPGWGKPPDARVRAMNLPVYNMNYLTIEQWRNVTHVDPKSAGGVYDWFETRTLRFVQGVSSESELGIVLSKTVAYIQSSAVPYGLVRPAHEAGSTVMFNLYYTEMRLDDEAPTPFCGRSRPKIHTDAIIHEARHCYQNFLTVQWLGQNDEPPGQNLHPDNDDDLDYLVDVVPIAPTSYNVDSDVNRLTCSGEEVHFQGDGQADSGAYDSQVFEKDAVEFTHGKYQ